jgi:glycosyltransferase involved in cell wall biosynthesis
MGMQKLDRTGSPFFSIITVVLNGAPFISDCIDSLRNQTFRNFEYIVIDGGSTDGSIEIIEKNLDQIGIFISESDFGIYDAMNKGIKLAKGKYIGIINSDDMYNFQALEIVFNHLLAQTNECVIYGGITGTSPQIQYENISHFELPKKMIYHPATFVASSVYKRLGAFDLSYRIAADYEFILRCFVKGVPFIRVEDSIAFYREGGFSHKHQYRSIFETFLIQIRAYPKKSPKTFMRFCKVALGTFVRNNIKFLAIRS